MVIDYLKDAEVYKILANEELARNLETIVKRDMRGRIASEQNNAMIVACFCAIAGDHLEIGSLHGGSAILVALMKRELNLPGKVFCVDPLDGYYTGLSQGHSVDPVTRIPVTRETIEYNINRFDLQDRIEIIQKKSDPFPVKNQRFSTVYIDGDHWGDAPLIDWENCQGVTDRYVIFDNCDKDHPSVLDACLKAAFSDGWVTRYKHGISCVFERF